MNPNSPSNFQGYSNQFKPTQYGNYQFSNQPQFNQNTLNIPKNNFHQGGSLSPTDSHQVNRNKLDRAMYSSTIQGTLPSKSFGLGKLQSMGRFIGGNDQHKNQSNKPSFDFSSSNGQHREYGFQEQKQKTFEPLSANHRQNQFDRFPSFNIQDNHSHQQFFSSYSQSSQQQQKPVNSGETLTPEQKRRREILAIKQELEMINKKMQSSNLSKKFTPQNEKNDFKTPTTNPTVTVNGNTNNYLNPTSSSTNSTFGSSSNYGSDLNGGLSFSKSNQLSVGQRNKGLVTQSMIVTNQPSAGFKSQSIFDKYESMKKPTYQTYNAETKEERPSLLDKFVNKGPGSQLGKQKQTNTFNFSSSSNNVNSYTNKAPTYDFSSSSKSNESTSSFTSSFSSSTTSNTSNIGSAMTFGNNNTQPAKQGGGMFKKKKFTEQTKTQFTPTINTTKVATQNQGGMFKKTKPQNFEENFVTNAMKQMKIQESTDFKKEDFIVGKKLGKGQFGQVMLVQHKKTGFLCGMKVMEKKQIRDQKYQGQIARQLSIQFYLAHRNIAPLYGYFQDEKAVYLLVEYCTGGQLLEMLRKNRRMEEPQVSRYIKQIIEGIDYIHKELIIHRDIKPENILFNFGVAKICDFGWAVYKGHGMRKTASVGSPLYYSPEIVMGVQYDEKIDIWDIGMMTYECLLGKIPFRIYSELDLNRIVQDEIKFPQYIETSQEAKDFILRIMKKKPEERMQIREMLRHPFITKYQDQKLPVQIMKDFKEVLSG